MSLGIAAHVSALLRSLRGSEQSRIAPVPGQRLLGTPRAEQVLKSWGIYEGRVGPSGGPTKDRWALWPADDLTPERIISAQRSAITSGIPLTWVEMIDHVDSRDGHYASTTRQRVADVIKGTWRLTPATVDDAGLAAMNFVDRTFRRTERWTDGLGWLLQSNLYGFNGVEIEWQEKAVTFPGPKNERIGPVAVAVPKRLHPIHPKHFRFDIDTDDPLFWIAQGYVDLPIGKFIFLDGEGQHPIKVRHGHAWQCIWYSMFRSVAAASWASRVERFEMPIPMLGYDGDLAQYDEYKAAFEDINAALGSGAGFRFPRGNMTVDIKDPPRGGTANDPQSALWDACDAAQSIRVLGGQLNNKIGNVGSFAASSNHLDVKYGIEELDAMRLWERIDEQLSAPLLLFNAEPLADALNAAGYNVTPDELAAAVPRGKHHIPGKTDPMVEMQVMQAAVGLGMPISMRGAFERMDLERARDDADRIPGEAQVVGKGAALKTDKDAASQDDAVNPDEAALAKVAADKQAAEAAAKAPPPAPVAEEKQANGKH